MPFFHKKKDDVIRQTFPVNDVPNLASSAGTAMENDEMRKLAAHLSQQISNIYKKIDEIAQQKTEKPKVQTEQIGKREIKFPDVIGGGQGGGQQLQLAVAHNGTIIVRPVRIIDFIDNDREAYTISGNEIISKVFWDIRNSGNKADVRAYVRVPYIFYRLDAVYGIMNGNYASILPNAVWRPAEQNPRGWWPVDSSGNYITPTALTHHNFIPGNTLYHSGPATLYKGVHVIHFLGSNALPDPPIGKIESIYDDKPLLNTVVHAAYVQEGTWTGAQQTQQGEGQVQQNTGTLFVKIAAQPYLKIYNLLQTPFDADLETTNANVKFMSRDNTTLMHFYDTQSIRWDIRFLSNLNLRFGLGLRAYIKLSVELDTPSCANTDRTYIPIKEFIYDEEESKLIIKQSSIKFLTFRVGVGDIDPHNRCYYVSFQLDFMLMCTATTTYTNLIKIPSTDQTYSLFIPNSGFYDTIDDIYYYRKRDLRASNRNIKLFYIQEQHGTTHSGDCWVGIDGYVSAQRNTSAPIYTREILNFIDTESAIWTITDNPANNSIDIRLTATGMPAPMSFTNVECPPPSDGLPYSPYGHVWKDVVSGNLVRFRAIGGSGGTNIVELENCIVIQSRVRTSSCGTGQGDIFLTSEGYGSDAIGRYSLLQYRKIAAGNGIVITQDECDITISTNLQQIEYEAVNVGTGSGLVARDTDSSGTLRHHNIRSLLAGQNISIETQTNEIIIRTIKPPGVSVIYGTISGGPALHELDLGNWEYLTYDYQTLPYRIYPERDVLYFIGDGSQFEPQIIGYDEYSNPIYTKKGYYPALPHLPVIVYAAQSVEDHGFYTSPSGGSGPFAVAQIKTRVLPLLRVVGSPEHWIDPNINDCGERSSDHTTTIQFFSSDTIEFRVQPHPDYSFGAKIWANLKLIFANVNCGDTFGAYANVYKDISGGTVRFRALTSSGGTTVTELANCIEIKSRVKAETCGTGEGDIFVTSEGYATDANGAYARLQYRKLKAGTNITISQDGCDITIDANIPDVAEYQLLNIGNGEGHIGIEGGATGTDPLYHNLKTIKAGENIVVYDAPQEVIIASELDRIQIERWKNPVFWVASRQNYAAITPQSLVPVLFNAQSIQSYDTELFQIRNNNQVWDFEYIGNSSHQFEVKIFLFIKVSQITADYARAFPRLCQVRWYSCDNENWLAPEFYDILDISAESYNASRYNTSSFETTGDYEVPCKYIRLEGSCIFTADNQDYKYWKAFIGYDDIWSPYSVNNVVLQLLHGYIEIRNIEQNNLQISANDNPFTW